MDSGTIGDSNGDLNTRVRFPTESRIVYTRRPSKKVPKSSNRKDTAANTTSVTQTRSDLASSANTTSENPTTTPTPADVSSVPVPAPAATTAGGPNDSAIISPLPSNHDSPTATTTSIGNQGDVREYPGPPVAKDVDSSQQSLGDQSPRHEQVPSHKSADKDSDSSLHDQQLHEEHHNHAVSSPEDDSFTPNKVQKDSGCQIAEKRSSLPDGDEVENLKTPCPLDNEKKLPHACFGGQNLRESSKFVENDLPNGREVAVARNSCGNEGEPTQIPSQVTRTNEPTNNVNWILKPLVRTLVNDRIRFNLFKETPKNEIEDLRKKLEGELHKVRIQVERIEAKKLELSSYNTPLSNSNHGNGMIYVSAESRNVGDYSNVQFQRPLVKDVIDNRARMIINSEVGVMGHREVRPMVLSRLNSDMGAARNLEPRPYNRQFSVTVMENNHRDNEFVEREKRTPKANQYYRNSEFLLGKDRLPPESNKRLKANNVRRYSVQPEHAFGFGFRFDKSRNQGFKSCSSLLQRLMKHRYGWVFNEPVNDKALGLVDYHDIIKYPMDLGTIKTRLSQNYYKSPREFADDVRLVFRNAMTYNPKGHDVHIMAEELSQIFEERWAVIETECNHYWDYLMYQNLPTPTSRNLLLQSHFAPASVPGPVPRNVALPVNVLARTGTMAVDPKIQRPHSVRTPVPKKPKAGDLNKRDMTRDEKQRLSTNLQGLPSEKLDAIVQIIKRRNTALSQHDDEIEVDIDNVDAETLWELDRFVTNYKKSLSKNKRKAEHALQARKAANGTVVPMNTGPAVSEMQLESAALGKSDALPAVDGENQRYINGSRSSSSSSSSSDSGSSSDSDGDSSSADGSAHSPKT